MSSLVSVIIPTYNRRDYVQEAIDSVLAQTYTHYEIIVVDDGSTDGTGVALMARYAHCIRYEWQENQGESAARNRGIEMAQGEYVAFLDSDDTWLPEKLEKQVAYLEAHPDVGAVLCPGLLVDEDGNALPGDPVRSANLRAQDLTFDALLYANTTGGPSMQMVRSDLLVLVGGFDPAIRYGEDWDLMLRLSTRTRIGTLAEPLCCIRWHRDGQWRSRPRDLIEPTLNDRLRIIAKGFSLVPTGDGAYQALRRQAEAREYGDAALFALAWGEYNRASEWLIQGAGADPERLTNPAGLAKEYLALLPGVQERTARFSPGQLQGALSGTLGALSAAHFDPPSRRVFAQVVLGSLFFEAAHRGDRAVVRWVFPRLLRADPTLARNLGVWSIALTGFLGETRAARIKRNLRIPLRLFQSDDSSRAQEANYDASQPESVGRTRRGTHMTKPSVSVIVPTYDREGLLPRCLNSVLSQTYSDLELIVVDDGSHDGTKNLVAALAAIDGRVRYIRHAVNRGVSAALNTGIRAARGEFIALIGSDDEWTPLKLAKQLDLFRKGPARLGVVHCGCTKISDSGDAPEYVLVDLRGDVYVKLLERYGVLQAILVRRSCFDVVGGFNEHLEGCEDWDMCIRLARHYQFDYVPEPLAIYHIHGGPSLTGDVVHNMRECLRMIRLHEQEILTMCGAETLRSHRESIRWRLVSRGHGFRDGRHFRQASSAYLAAALIPPIQWSYLVDAGSILFGSRVHWRVWHLKERLRSSITRSRTPREG